MFKLRRLVCEDLTAFLVIAAINCVRFVVNREQRTKKTDGHKCLHVPWSAAHKSPLVSTSSPNVLTRLCHPYPITTIPKFALAAEGRDRLAEVLPIGDKQIVEGHPMRRRQFPT